MPSVQPSLSYRFIVLYRREPREIGAAAEEWRGFVHLLAQGVPVEVLVKGPRAQMLYEVLKRTQRDQPRSIPFEPITIVAGIAIVAVIAAVVMLGFMVLYAVLTNAMEKGYDVKDTKYKAAAGEGATRHEHELLFNLQKPGP